jgi:hypothetical protein
VKRPTPRLACHGYPTEVWKYPLTVSEPVAFVELRLHGERFGLAGSESRQVSWTA